MVGHCRFLLTEEKKAEMEEGGGTKESTKVMRKTIGANFQQYVEEREAWWCGDPREAASWWTPPGGLGEPRRVGEIATMDNAWLVGHYARDFLWEAQVSHKNSEGVVEWTYPMYHTAAGLRSHLKNFVMETYKLNLADPIVFPKWNDWWKAYKGEVLKPNGKMKVDNRPHLSPDFMESVMELLAQAQAVYAARGTKEYPAMLALLPEGYRDNYHQIIQKGAQYVVTLFLAQRAVESIKVMDVTDLVKEEDDTLEFSYWREASRGSSKNHYADLESAQSGGVIPDLLLTNGAYKFNPCSILETYIGMRNPKGLPRLMMKPMKSLTFKVHGAKSVPGKFNLHSPETTICFSDKQVIGKHMVSHMCEDLASMMNLPKCTNSQLRSTAIQALRMAAFELEDIQKVSRHARKETITLHYDPGQRTSTRANMAVAIAQAAAMRRGEEFQPVAPALVRKKSKARVPMAAPVEMIPRRSSSLQLVDTMGGVSSSKSAGGATLAQGSSLDSVAAGSATLTQGSNLVSVAAGSATLTQGSNLVSVAAGSATLTQGSNLVSVAAGSATLTQGTSVDSVAAGGATLTQSTQGGDTLTQASSIDYVAGIAAIVTQGVVSSPTTLTQTSRGASSSAAVACSPSSITQTSRVTSGPAAVATRPTITQASRGVTSLNAAISSQPDVAPSASNLTQGGLGVSSLLSKIPSTTAAPSSFRSDGFKAAMDAKKPTVVSYLEGHGGPAAAAGGEEAAEDSSIYKELWRFKEAEGLTDQDSDMMSFKGLLVRENIQKIVTSGFKNGKEGHVTLPPSLLGSTEDSQLIFVKCKSNGNPKITEKLVMARANGLRVADSKYLQVWASCGRIPATLEQYPATCAWGSRANHREILTPLTTPIFGGQFFCFVDSQGWLLSPTCLANAITKLGGTVVDKEERWQVDGPVFSLSSVEVEGEEELYEYDWVVQMVVAGKFLRREHFLLDTAEDLAASQAVVPDRRPELPSKPKTASKSKEATLGSGTSTGAMLPPPLQVPYGYPWPPPPFFHYGQRPPGASPTAPYTSGYSAPYPPVTSHTTPCPPGYPAHPGASHTTPFPPGYPAPYPPYNGAAPTFASFTHPYSGVTQHFPGFSSPEPAGETKPGT